VWSFVTSPVQEGLELGALEGSGSSGLMDNRGGGRFLDIKTVNGILVNALPISWADVVKSGPRTERCRLVFGAG